nr:MAG TPA: hypothetical protein [Caudoviricetes sp.]
MNDICMYSPVLGTFSKKYINYSSEYIEIEIQSRTR